jgi:hypothetical protein
MIDGNHRNIVSVHLCHCERILQLRSSTWFAERGSLLDGWEIAWVVELPRNDTVLDVAEQIQNIIMQMNYRANLLSLLYLGRSATGRSKWLLR